MKNLKRILLVVPLALCCMLLVGCSSKTETGDLTIAKSLAKQFQESIQDNSLEDTMKKVSDKVSEELNVEVAKLVDGEDYIAGFTTEIKGFKDGYVIRPMIGSIPFVAYAFEVEDATSFEKTLKEKADLRWNICTEADSIETTISDNYVFVVMSPDSFED